MSLMRMQESPTRHTLGDSCIRRNDSNKEFLHKLIGRNDMNEPFDTASGQ
ncbi:MAG: hypothetical protein NT007_08865 [Candidatus Kapabacteria bacterium]|nr:hypothetical protein [Candidatus Kapabacteria bacterium]